MKDLQTIDHAVLELVTGGYSFPQAMDKGTNWAEPGAMVGQGIGLVSGAVVGGLPGAFIGTGLGGGVGTVLGFGAGFATSTAQQLSGRSAPPAKSR